jgi:hypothetical protein
MKTLSSSPSPSLIFPRETQKNALVKVAVELCDYVQSNVVKNVALV